MNNYYVYIYYRLDTNEPFYIGKGKGNRWKVLSPSKRNIHFINIINKYSVVCEIIKSNLTEEEALYWEEEIIRQLVFEYGYSIDITDNRSIEKGCHLVNQTWGGEGASGYKHCSETIQKISNVHKGKYVSDKTRQILSETRKGKYIGKNNYMYGRHHTEDVKEKISKSRKEKYSKENHPCYGKYGKESNHFKSVICLTTKRIFPTIKEASKFYECDASRISQCCKGYTIKNGKRIKVKSAGKLPNGMKLVWRYLNWKHNKFYRIKRCD